MDIKFKKRKSNYTAPKKIYIKTILLSLFFSFFFLVVVGIGFFYAYKQGIGISTVKQWANQIVFWLPYHTKSFFISPEKISIHIKHMDYQHLAFEREKALNSSENHREGMDFSYVPASIMYLDKLIPVKIRLKGDRQIHFEHDNQWSFRIKVKNDNTIYGMKNFSIQKPRARNYIHEWIFHEVLRREDLISGRYFFAEVDINGNNLGIYAFEEHFEKRLIENNQLREAPILKFEENRSRNFRVSLIAPFDEKSLADTVQFSYFNKANELLDGFRRGTLSISDVFDSKKLGKYFAITDILQMPHGALWKSIRFYYNPITSLIEPIGYDGHHGIELMGNNSFLVCEIGVNSDAGWIHDGYGDWFKMIFNENETFDYNFVSSYFSSLWKFTDSEYFDELFDEIGDNLENNLTLIARDFPLLADHALSFGPDLFTFSKKPFYDRQKRIRNNLNNLSLHAHIGKIENGKVNIELGNPETLPMIVEGLSIKDSLITPINMNHILPARDANDYIKYQSIIFQCDTTLQKMILDSLNFVKIVYSLPGWGQSSETEILPFIDPLSLPNNSDLIRNLPSMEKIQFVEIDSISKSIFINKGKWIVDKDIAFPGGYKVYASEGVELNLINNACILSYSPLFLKGSEDLKIHIFSSDTTGQGIAILNAKESSVFENVVFENLSNISKSGWILTSAINFYESNISIKDCLFLNNHSEDFLNIIRSNFTVTNSEFHNVFSDAFDADFADGSLADCKFINCGNDAIDISGSKVLINNVIMDGIGDKGLSAGEKSELIAKNVTIRNSEIAVASKDLSEISAESINISDCRIGYTVFQKKSEYGAAVIRVSGGRLINVELQYLLEENSALIVDGVSRNPDRTNVQDILYGVEYGKSSKAQ